MKMAFKQWLVLVGTFLLCMSCVHFGGVKPYTSNFGVYMFVSMIISIVVTGNVEFSDDE